MEFNKKNNSITITVPEGIDGYLDTALCMHPPKFKFRWFKDNFMFIIGKIVNLSLNNPKFKRLDKVPISSIILMKEIGRHYRKYIDYLLQYNIITCDNHYIVGGTGIEGKCKCYGIGSKFKKTPKTTYTINKKTIITKYFKWKEAMFGKIADDEMLSKLYSMLNRFTIDIDGAELYLRKLLDTNADPDLNEEKIQIELRKCHVINNKDDKTSIFIVRDDYGRIHTNFTNLSRHVRDNFLFLDGERVIGIDMVSSQASLLYTMLLNYINKVDDATINKRNSPLNKYAMILEELDYLKTDIRSKYVNSHNFYTGDPLYSLKFEPSISTLGYNNYTDMLSIARSELSKMEGILKSGIYEYFQMTWKKWNREDKTRSQMKKLWITYVFGKPDQLNKKMRIVWEREFPMLNRIILHFKKIDYRILAHTLQRTESNIVFNDVCSAINDKLNIPYCTVHDSVIVQEQYVHSTKVIFETALINNNVVTGVK